MSVVDTAALGGPVMVAAGCGGTGRELAGWADLSGVGFVTRSISREPRGGNAMPRIVESPSGLVHCVGLDNPGLEAFLATELPVLVRAGARTFVSVVAGSLGEFAQVARRLGSAPGVCGVEVNLSAPDVSDSGVFDAREAFHAATAVAAVRRELPSDLPVLAKLRSDPARVVETARAVHDAGAGAVVVGNALAAVMPDGRPAGLSGPATRPVALACVRAVHDAVPDLPVVGVGGVDGVAATREFLDAGAVAVQVGTALLHDPTTLTRLVRDLEETA